MLKADVLAYFDDNQSAVARALGIGRAAVHDWRDVIPEGWAYKLQAVTHGDLKVDPAFYPKRTRRRVGAL